MGNRQLWKVEHAEDLEGCRKECEEACSFVRCLASSGTALGECKVCLRVERRIFELLGFKLPNRIESDGRAHQFGIATSAFRPIELDFLRLTFTTR